MCTQILRRSIPPPAPPQKKLCSNLFNCQTQGLLTPCGMVFQGTHFGKHFPKFPCSSTILQGIQINILLWGWQRNWGTGGGETVVAAWLPSWTPPPPPPMAVLSTCVPQPLLPADACVQLLPRPGKETRRREHARTGKILSFSISANCVSENAFTSPNAKTHND